MFSFQLYDKVNGEFWPELIKILPPHYEYPDPLFLQTLVPLSDCWPYILNSDNLVTDLGREDIDLWKSLTAKLPNHYSIPDTAVIKRLCEL